MPLKIIQSPSTSQIDTIVRKSWKSDTILLHYTGSIYGIGCSAFSTQGVERINQLKQRPLNQGYIVLIPDFSWLERLDIHPDTRTGMLMNQFWPGNVTFIVPCQDPRLQHVTRDGKLAIRVPDSTLLLNFIRGIDVPLVSTSVNKGGFPPMNDLKEIRKKTEDWFDLALIPARDDFQPEAVPSTVVEVIDDTLRCLREGSIPFYELRNSFEKPKVLFTCTGNICRSPIAEYIFRSQIQQHNLSFDTASAGILGSGVPISKHSHQVLLEHGINAEQHFSHYAELADFRSSWLILTMEVRQRDLFRQKYPFQAHKIFAFMEYCGDEGDVADPYGMDLPTYQKTYDIIESGIQTLIKRLIKE